MYLSFAAPLNPSSFSSAVSLGGAPFPGNACFVSSSPLISRGRSRLGIIFRNEDRKTLVQRPQMILTSTQIENKSYQLEEMEDAEACSSALYLKANGSVAMGVTDGPQPSAVQGTWNYDDDKKELRMDITRFFAGDYPFKVRRLLIGHLDERKGSDLVVFSGNLFRESSDFSPEEAVGYFSMIVATDDLPSEDYDISQEQ